MSIRRQHDEGVSSLVVKWHPRNLLALAPAFVIVAGLFGGGLLMGLLQALGAFPAWGSNGISLVHFSNVLHDPDFVSSLLLTFYISLASTIIAATLSILFSLLLFSSFEKVRFLNLVLQIPLVVPHLVIAVAAAFLLAPSGMVARLAQQLHLINSAAQFPLLVNDPFCIGIIFVYVWKEVPFITLMILSVLLNLGSELLDVGKSLKANRWQRFQYIIFPTILPSLSVASLIVFAYSFGAFETPFLLGQTYPMTLSVWAYRNFADIDLMSRPEGIAIGLIIAAVIALVLLAAAAVMKVAQSRRRFF